MVTAYSKDELTEKAKDIKHLNFLTKPTNASFLFDTIMSAFGRKITSRSRRNQRQEGFVKTVTRLRGANILLVEDNEINQELALELLSSNGINTTLAENGQQAVEKIQQQSFDGVLMDIQMPIMDGYSATKIIRKLETGKELPIIAMTANAMASDIEHALQAGMNDHISKPINVSEMFNTMAKWISPSSPVSDTNQNSNVKLQTEFELELPQLTGIDCNAGLTITQGNKKLYRRLLIKFLQNEQNFSEQFSQARLSDDVDAATRVAHTLKGVAGNIGAHDIQKAASDLEKICQIKGDNHAIGIALEALEMVLMPVLDSLKQLLPQEQTPTNDQAVNIAELSPLFQNLMELLLDDDADAVEVLEEIISMIGENKAARQLNELRNLIEHYSYDEAIELVKAIAEQLSIKIS